MGEGSPQERLDDHRRNPMKSLSQWIVGTMWVGAGCLGVGLSALTASAQDIGPDARDRRQDRQDVRQDTRDIRQDRRDISNDTKDIRQDRRDINQDTRDIRHDRRDVATDRQNLLNAEKSGNQTGADRRDVGQDRRDLRRDVAANRVP
jgi:septal ring factor EnvC (AmiA/AmiB activator)